MEITIQNKLFILDYRKALFDIKNQRLILADLHVGKSAHFRKAGQSMPSYVFQTDLKRLASLLDDYLPKQVLILGDLFHSDHNDEFHQWNTFLANYSTIEFQLVIGNHDRKSIKKIPKTSMLIRSDFDEEGVFYTHEPKNSEEAINFCGHIHPGVIMQGLGRQKIKLSCFWLSERRLIIPAFSKLTGLGIVRPHKSDRVFVAVEEKIVELPMQVS